MRFLVLLIVVLLTLPRASHPNDFDDDLRRADVVIANKNVDGNFIFGAFRLAFLLVRNHFAPLHFEAF